MPYPNAQATTYDFTPMLQKIFCCYGPVMTNQIIK
jgi:hypothetical protein